jgi:enoyl-CoA hydratase
MNTDRGIEWRREGGLALVTLDRPAALNALTFEMIGLLDGWLREWAADPAVRVVAIEGAGGRAFCAGGDIRVLYESGRRGEALARSFYHHEYRLDHRIKTFPKPFVAFMDGIAMGGGVGVSVHGSHRIATERSLFAMPEAQIGFFPDVGATWFLPRCPGRVGLYLGLTGTRIGAADMLHAGLATHAMESRQWPALVEALARAEPADATAVVERHAAAPDQPAQLPERRAGIDRCFAAATVEAILEALDGEAGPWAGEAAAAMRRASPTSLKVTLKAVGEAARLDFAQALRMEYRLSQRFMGGQDFFEGVRAAVIDKDRRPHWKPARLGDVTDGDVAAYFAPLDEPDLNFD